MRVLIVYANPNPESLSNRVKNLISGVLKKRDFEVEVRDLYQMQFNPVFSQADQSDETRPADVKREQEFISWAELIYFIYPIWWSGFPAIMKGYFDRVFSHGFAYSFSDQGVIKHLEGKKAVIINHHGSPEAAYNGDQYHALRLTSDEGIMRFCGIEVLEHKFFPSAVNATEDEKKAYLEEIRNLCEKLH